jgi:hypothetical protein
LGLEKDAKPKRLDSKKRQYLPLISKTPFKWGFSAFYPSLSMQGYPWGEHLNKLVLTNLNTNPKLAQYLHSPM